MSSVTETSTSALGKQEEETIFVAPYWSAACSFARFAKGWPNG